MPESPTPPSLAAFVPADLPSPLKALAGIALTMAHDVKHLPERAVQLPGSVVTRLAAKSLKIQQQYAEWVARGEEFLGSLQEPSEEIPPWATFDEDLPAPEPSTEEDVRASREFGLGPGSAFDLQEDDDLPVARRRARRTMVSGDAASGGVDDAAEASAATPAKGAARAKNAAPAKKKAAAKTSASAKKASGTKAPATKKATDAAASGSKATEATASGSKATGATGMAGPHTAGAGADQADPAAQPARAADSAPSTPPAADTRGALQSLPDFDTLTIPQLRTRLKTLRTPELRELIAYEESGRNRAPVVGMLRARLDMLQK